MIIDELREMAQKIFMIGGKVSEIIIDESGWSRLISEVDERDLSLATKSNGDTLITEVTIMTCSGPVKIRKKGS